MAERHIPTFEYWVEYMCGDKISLIGVVASYLQEEGRLIVFKDAGHSVVFAVAGNMLLSVTRKPVEQEVSE